MKQTSTQFSLLLFTVLTFLLPITLSAQAPWIGGFSLRKVGLSIGQDQDMLDNMEAAYFISTARPDDLSYDYSGLELDPSYAFSMICENPHLRLNTTWENFSNPNLQLGLNLLFVSGRIDAMRFRSPDRSSYLNVTQTTNEFALEPTIGYRLGKGSWQITGKIGANVGYHYGTLSLDGRVHVCEDDKVIFRDEASEGDEPNCFSTYVADHALTRGGFSTRLFAETQFAFQIARRLEMGLHFRLGKGLRFANGGSTQSATLHSVGVSTAWILR